MPKDSTRTDPRPARAAGRWLFLGLALAMMLAYPRTPRANENSRLNLVFAVVDHGTLTIDAYHNTPPHRTNDKAFYDGHFYSDKIIGLSLVATPVYALLRTAAGGPVNLILAHWVLKAVTAGLAGALSGWLFFHLLVSLGVPAIRALGATVLSVYGTMWFGYSTVFYPYLPGIAAMLGGLWLVLDERPMGRGRSLGIGTLMGAALLMDFVFAPAVLGVSVLWLSRLLSQRAPTPTPAPAPAPGSSPGNGLCLGVGAGVNSGGASGGGGGWGRTLLGWAGHAGAFWAGVLLVLSPFFAYCLLIFGDLSIPYRHLAYDVYQNGMSQGLMGVGAPRALALYFLTVHPYRGVFFWSPILVPAAVGGVLGMRRGGRFRAVGGLGTYALAVYLLFNAGYYMWWGGFAMGPRLMLPMLPLTLLGLGELLRPCRRPYPMGRVAVGSVWMTGLVSVLLCMPLALNNPTMTQRFTDMHLMSLSPDDPVGVPQFEVLRLFYTGHLILWRDVLPTASLSGVAYRLVALGASLVFILLAVIPLLVARRRAGPWRELRPDHGASPRPAERAAPIREQIKLARREPRPTYVPGAPRR